MKDRLRDAIALNEAIYNDYYVRLRQLALSVFEWTGLPETCSPRFLEMTLCDYGRAILVNDKELGFLNLRCNPVGTFNVYMEPTRLNAWSINYNKGYDRGADDNTYIRNNYEEYPTDVTLRIFARKLAENDRTIDINRAAQKTPVLIETDENTRLTLQNVYEQYRGNVPFIYGNKNFKLGNALNVLKTDAPYLLDKLYIDKMNIWNECLTFLGINNANTDKRERLITDEANANNEMISMSAETMLKTRREAAEEITKKFDITVTVRRKTFDELLTSGEGKGDGVTNE